MIKLPPISAATEYVAELAVPKLIREQPLRRSVLALPLSLLNRASTARQRMISGRNDLCGLFIHSWHPAIRLSGRRQIRKHGSQRTYVIPRRSAERKPLIQPMQLKLSQRSTLNTADRHDGPSPRGASYTECSC